MAAEDGSAPKHLGFLRDVARAADRYGVFPVLRGAEARAPDLPRIGMSRLPANNVVDLKHTASMAFPASTLEKIEVKGGRANVFGYWLGLTGPMGPLPLHMTEFAQFERRYSQKRPFSQFLDLLAGRMLQLFFRAWADSQPAAQADRPNDDQFAFYLGALSGAVEGVPRNSAFPARARLRYAGLFASRRSAGALEDAMRDLLAVPVRLLEFEPRWRDIEPADRTRLGKAFNMLGGDAVIGGKVQGFTDAFRLKVRARGMREYEDFLPTGSRFAIAAEALDAFKPSHLEWDLALELDQAEARPLRLDGRGRLGWTGWLSPLLSGGAKADAHLTRHAMRKVRSPGEAKP